MFYPWFKMLIRVKRVVFVLTVYWVDPTVSEINRIYGLPAWSFFQLDNWPRFVARPIRIFLNIKEHLSVLMYFLVANKISLTKCIYLIK